MCFSSPFKQLLHTRINPFRSTQEVQATPNTGRKYNSQATDEESFPGPSDVTGVPDTPLRVILKSPTLPEFRLDTTHTAPAYGGLTVTTQFTNRDFEVSSNRSSSLSSSFCGSCAHCTIDHQTSPLTPSSSSTMNSHRTLKKSLIKARINCPRGSREWIIPQCEQKALITESAIMHGAQVSVEDAKSIRKYSRQLYGTLELINRGSEIVAFMKESVTDKQLPFKRTVEDESLFHLTGRAGETIRVLESWDEEVREEFWNWQRLMTAPFFEPGCHYEFDDNTVLPFVNSPDGERETEYRGGGYSEVHIKCIHPSHHCFWDTSQHGNPTLVAIKKLHSPKEEEFRKEESILKALAPKPHPHLLKLLATYRQLDKGEVKWNLIFPCADDNLRGYWEHQKPNPKLDEATIMWTLKQMSGMADGLNRVHVFRVTHHLSVEGTGGVRVRDGAKMSVKEGEERYGRHGDIKPENILWFRKDPDYKDDNGILKIGDFGLGRFHGLDSRSEVRAKSVWGTPGYEPPELKLGTPVSRAYDIWSFGCLCLEFVTWLLEGAKAVGEFEEHRAETVLPQMTDDSFYSIIRDSRGEAKHAVVREGVKTWVRRLHENNNCSDLIHDILDLVMKDMLVIDREQRMSSGNLHQSFEGFKKAMEQNTRYALLPNPYPADVEPSRPMSGKRKSQNVSFQLNENSTESIFRRLSDPRRSSTWRTYPT